MYLICIFVLIEFMLNGKGQIISKLYMVPQPSILNTGRDGFLIATLNTGENTTICNYRFNDEDANVACATLGYPPQGLSIGNPNSPYNGSVLIGDIGCKGSEANLGLCLNSGRIILGSPCSSHKMDVYLYCLQDKVSPQISTNAAVTNCNASNSKNNFQFVPTDNKKNTGFLKYSSRYVCNDDFGITVADVKYLCGLFCDVVVNPLPVMYLNVDNTSVSYVRVNPTGYTATNIPSCLKSTYALAMQCGNEPVIIEPSPNITCRTQNITATWLSGTQPAINPSLVSFAVPCGSNANISSNATFDVIAFVSFANCAPTISTTTSSIVYSYVLTRAYVPVGITSIAARNITISCSIPRSDSARDNLTFVGPSVSQLTAPATIPIIMVFYTDSGFQTLMPLPYTIYDDKRMYVKVTLQSTISNLRLGLVNCKVSTSDTMGGATSSNSLALISNSCPSTDTTYNVAIYPLTRKDVGFSFNPYKINGISKLYVHCETTKCFMDTYDSDCLTCGSTSRRKRSIISTEEISLGPFFIL